MKFQDIRQKSVEELRSILKDLRLKLGKARFELANNTLKDMSIIKKTKKDIARTLTAIKIESSK